MEGKKSLKKMHTKFFLIYTLLLDGDRYLWFSSIFFISTYKRACIMENIKFLMKKLKPDHQHN